MKRLGVVQVGKPEILERLESETPALLSKRICTFIAQPSVYNTANILTIKHLSQIFKTGICVGMSRPYKIINEELEKEKVLMDNILFIDCVTKVASTGALSSADEEHCSFISDPGSFTELSTVLTQKIQKNKYDYIYFDCISAALIYKDLQETKRFLYYITNKLRLLNVKGIIFSLDENGTKEFNQTLEEMSDNVVFF